MSEDLMHSYGRTLPNTALCRTTGDPMIQMTDHKDRVTCPLCRAMLVQETQLKATLADAKVGTKLPFRDVTWQMESPICWGTRSIMPAYAIWIGQGAPGAKVNEIDGSPPTEIHRCSTVAEAMVFVAERVAAAKLAPSELTAVGAETAADPHALLLIEAAGWMEGYCLGNAAKHMLRAVTTGHKAERVQGEAYLDLWNEYNRGKEGPGE